MAKIDNIQIRSYVEYSAATYVDDDGEEYDIGFSRAYDDTIGYEEKTVVNVEKDGTPIVDELTLKNIRACLP